MLHEKRGNLASFDLSVELLEQLLRMPNGARIERMHPSNRRDAAITLVVSHPDFKDVMWGEWIPEIVAQASYEDGRLVIEWDL